MNLLGKCFDRADWETITGGSGKVAKDTFITTVTVRNHAPSLRAWLEFWRIDELLEILESLGMLPWIRFLCPAVVSSFSLPVSFITLTTHAALFVKRAIFDGNKQSPRRLRPSTRTRGVPS